MAVVERSTEAFVERAFADLAACYAGVMISTGHKLGLYRALAGQGPLSSHEVAARTGCDERYVREWLNSQVAGAYLVYHEESETYELPAEHDFGYPVSVELSPGEIVTVFYLNKKYVHLEDGFYHLPYVEDAGGIMSVRWTLQ